MTMIEKVARALFAKDQNDPQSIAFSAVDEVVRSHYRHTARAAIEAMRETTEAMDDAGAKEQQAEWGDGGISVPLEPQVAGSTFAAMIDAALKEQA